MSSQDDMNVIPGIPKREARVIRKRHRFGKPSPRPTLDDVLSAAARDDVAKFEAWFAARVMNPGHIERYVEPNTGNTVLHVAAIAGSLHVIKWLLDMHARPDFFRLRNRKGKRAVDLARKRLWGANDRYEEFMRPYGGADTDTALSIYNEDYNRQFEKRDAAFEERQAPFLRDLRRSRKIVVLLERALQRPGVGIGELIGIAIKHGSLKAIQKIEQRYPGFLDEEHLEQAEALNHNHIASFISNLLQ